MMTNRDYRNALPDFLKDATNVYRTKDFIVKQVVSIKFDRNTFDEIISHDTFYFRTRERDAEYEYFLDFKKNINGKRMKTSMSARTYVY